MSSYFTLTVLENVVLPSKTWEKLDFLKHQDLRRIWINMTTCAAEVSALFNPVQLSDFTASLSNATFPKAEYINLIEGNLAALYAQLLHLPDWLPTVDWRASPTSPDYTDINRWERMIELIYNKAMTYYDKPYTYAYLKKRYTYDQMKQFTYAELSKKGDNL